MLANLFFGADSLARIGTIALDVSLNETHSTRSRVTDSPVEGGEMVSDHVFLDPREVEIEGLVTDAPVKYLSGERARLAGGGSPSRAARDKLIELWTQRTPVEFQTGLDVYEDMVIVDMQIPRSARLGQTFRFRARLRQVKRVRSRTTKIPRDQVRAVPEDTPDRAQSEIDFGRQATTTLDPGANAGTVSRVDAVLVA